jgi:hypothetical protein
MAAVPEPSFYYSKYVAADNVPKALKAQFFSVILIETRVMRPANVTPRSAAVAVVFFESLDGWRVAADF